jgi:hypothetical protein
VHLVNDSLLGIIDIIDLLQVAGITLPVHMAFKPVRILLELFQKNIEVTFIVFKNLVNRHDKTPGLPSIIRFKPLTNFYQLNSLFPFSDYKISSLKLGNKGFFVTAIQQASGA